MHIGADVIGAAGGLVALILTLWRVASKASLVMHKVDSLAAAFLDDKGERKELREAIGRLSADLLRLQTRFEDQEESNGKTISV